MYTIIQKNLAVRVLCRGYGPEFSGEGDGVSKNPSGATQRELGNLKDSIEFTNKSATIRDYYLTEMKLGNTSTDPEKVKKFRQEISITEVLTQEDKEILFSHLDTRHRDTSAALRDYYLTEMKLGNASTDTKKIEGFRQEVMSSQIFTPEDKEVLLNTFKIKS